MLYINYLHKYALKDTAGVGWTSKWLLKSNIQKIIYDINNCYQLRLAWILVVTYWHEFLDIIIKWHGKVGTVGTVHVHVQHVYVWQGFCTLRTRVVTHPRTRGRSRYLLSVTLRDW